MVLPQIGCLLPKLLIPLALPPHLETPIYLGMRYVHASSYLVAKEPPIIGSYLPSGPITYTTKVEKVMQNVCRVGVKMRFNLQSPSTTFYPSYLLPTYWTCHQWHQSGNGDAENRWVKMSFNLQCQMYTDPLSAGSWGLSILQEVLGYQLQPAITSSS